MIRPTLLLSLIAVAVPAAAVPPPPPVTPESRAIVNWLPGAVTCGGNAITPVALQRPTPSLGWGVSSSPVAPVTLRFRIDATGRPLTIDDSGVGGGSYTQDVAPSLAASRFPAGTARDGCTITYSYRATTLAETPIEDLVAYTVLPDTGPLPQPGWQRIRDPRGSTCFDDPRPQPLVRVLPDFARLPGTPGVRDWTLTAYDVDAKGHPVGVRTLYGSGNRALDDAALKAARQSRFAAGARTGCRYPYWREAVKLHAPDGPDPESLRPAGSTCPQNGDWARQPRLSYPQAFRRRQIEGWAIVAFDVAPWGETGNIRTLAAEPSAAFGREAVSVIRSAAKAPSPTGSTGCIERVRFVLDWPKPNEPLPEVY